MINELQEMLKNKIEFKELDVETKKIYVDKIEELNNRVYNYIYQENMFMQDEEFNNMNIKNYDKLYETIEEKTNNFLNGITYQLREYETVDYSLINEYIEYNDEFINDNMFSNLYIDQEKLKNNIYKIYNISINYNIYI